MPFVALTIAGSDPSGGAGIQADLKTFHQFGVYGEAAITLVTVQNSVRFSRVEIMPPDLVREQIAAVLDDIPPAAAKTGALGSAEVVEAVAEMAATFAFPLVVDPVTFGTHGRRLLSGEAVRVLRERLLPRAALVTPNIPEAEELSGIAIHSLDGMRGAACRILELGPRAVLIKGGHSAGDPVDLLFDGADWREFPAPRLDTPHTHGTGCTFASAIAANLARGHSLVDAFVGAQDYVGGAIRQSRPCFRWPCGCCWCWLRSRHWWATSTA